jgi:hypothetical protein
VFWEVTVSAILSKKVCMYTCPIPNGVDQKERLHTVSNTGIYCSSDRVGTVYLV